MAEPPNACFSSQVLLRCAMVTRTPINPSLHRCAAEGVFEIAAGRIIYLPMSTPSALLPSTLDLLRFVCTVSLLTAVAMAASVDARPGGAGRSASGCSQRIAPICKRLTDADMCLKRFQDVGSKISTRRCGQVLPGGNST